MDDTTVIDFEFQIWNQMLRRVAYFKLGFQILKQHDVAAFFFILTSRRPKAKHGFAILNFALSCIIDLILENLATRSISPCVTQLLAETQTHG